MIKILYLTLFLVLFSFTSFSQNQSKIDSLKRIIKETEQHFSGTDQADTTIVKVYNSIGMEFYNQYPDSALFYWRISESISQNLLNRFSESNVVVEDNNHTIYAIKKSLSATYNSIGGVFQNKGNIPLAMEYFNNSLILGEEIDDKESCAYSLNNIGYLYYAQGDIEKSVEYFERSLKIREEIGDRKGLSTSYSNIGFIYEDKGELNIALKYYNKSLSIREEIEDKQGIAYSLNNIGALYSKQGEKFKALEYYLKSLKIEQEIDDKKGIATAYNNIGMIYKRLGNIYMALDFYNKSLKIRESMGDKKSIASSLFNIGSIYDSQGDIIKALENYNNSLKIFEEIGYKKGLSYAYNNIGAIYSLQGNIPKALEFHNKNLSIKREIGDKQGEATALYNIGAIYSKQNNLSKALEYYEKGLKIKEKIGDKRGIAYIYSSIGAIYFKQNKRDLAEEYFQRSLKISEEILDKKGISLSYNDLGMLFYNQGDYINAMDNYQKSLDLKEELGNKDGMAITLFNMGCVSQDQKDSLEFKNYASRSYKISKELGFPANISKAASLMRDHMVLVNNLSSADSFALEIIDITNKLLISNFATLSELEQEKYFKTISYTYMDFNSYSFFRKNTYPSITEQVYNNTIQNKGLLLKSSTAMRNAVLESKDSILISNYYNWLNLNKKIAKMNSNGLEIDSLLNYANDLEKELIKRSKIFNDFKRFQNINWKDVKNSLKKKEAAIEFIQFRYKDFSKDYFWKWTDSVLYCALIVTPQSKYPLMIPLFEEKQLEEILSHYRGDNLLYINNLYNSNNEKIDDLYNLIWKPIEDALSGYKTIYLSPTGLLHKVSFSSIAKDHELFLSDIFDLQIKSSTASIVYPEEIDFNKRNIATLMGGINYNTDTTQFEMWNYLDGTAKETQQIKGLLNSSNFIVNYFSGTNATESEFKKIAPESNIIHISTHGFFYPDPFSNKEENNDTTLAIELGNVEFRSSKRGEYGHGVWAFIKQKDPLMRSGLVLAGANNVWNKNSSFSFDVEDGVLTAQEVSNLDLRKTDLVVMSACETGLGDISDSEGIYGLKRAFKMAGVKYLIMSLWQVADKETEEFMTLFYKNLTKTKNVKMAFNNTQRKMRKKYAPYFWAAFVLVE